jgi:hypothetical protein
MIHKKLFVALSAAIAVMNCCMSHESGLSTISSGLGITILSIPIWASLGGASSTTTLFILRLLKIEVTMTHWQRGNVGLALALVFKPLLGIGF